MSTSPDSSSPSFSTLSKRKVSSKVKQDFSEKDDDGRNEQTEQDLKNREEEPDIGEFSTQYAKNFSQRPSLLSSEYSANSYRGFLNLMIILLILSNFRLVLLNLLKYGILIDVRKLIITEWYRWPGVLITSTLGIFLLVAFALEKLAAWRILSDKIALTFQLINIIATVSIPAALVWKIEVTPGSGIIIMLFTSVLFMKLSSYVHFNHLLRMHSKKNPKSGWPQNITFSNLLYFVCIPTCVYRLEYPRSSRIRKGWLIRRIFEACFFSVLILAIAEQYIVPLVHNSIIVNEENESVRFLYLVERILKLSIPNLYLWLLGFYVLFHLYLNILAELTHFGDRLFYLDWWNSTTLSHYWSSWNLPVHNWMSDTIYKPLRKAGFSKNFGIFVCFFVSALFHELIIAIPFKMVKLWSFAGIMGQIPLIYMTNRLKGNQIGNVLFWFSIVLGQPFLILMIYRDWYQRYYANEIAEEIQLSESLY